MNRSRGFTLIELVIAIAIVGIIAAIAVPSFMEQIRKSRRSEALQGLTQIQTSQERWRSFHTTYGSGADIGLPTSDNYTFAITSGSNTATAWVATAAPRGAQLGDRCGTYTFTMSNGVVTKTAGSSNCGL